MSQQKYLYSLPYKAGDYYQIGELTGFAFSIVLSEIIERHLGLVVFVSPNVQNASRLKKEIRQFTNSMIYDLLDWETLPYDRFSPNQKIVSSRLSTFYQLPNIKRGMLIVSVNTLMQRVCPPVYLHGHSLIIKKGSRLSCNSQQLKLNNAGYRHVEKVIQHGEYATRESLLDLYPMGYDQPYRLNFSNKKIDSLRVFDLNSQRTLKEIEAIRLLPAHEFPTDTAAITLFQKKWQQVGCNIQQDPRHIYQQISRGLLPEGIEYWQPLFFTEELSPVFSYFPTNTLLVTTGDLESIASHFEWEIKARYKSCKGDPMRPPLPPEKLWLQTDELFKELQKFPRVDLQANRFKKALSSYIKLAFQALPNLSVYSQNEVSLCNLNNFLKSFNGSVIFSVENKRKREKIKELLKKIQVIPKRIYSLKEATGNGYYLMISSVEHGCIDTLNNRALISSNDLLNECQVEYHKDDDGYPYSINSKLLGHALEGIKIGQLVVHLEHGVGRYDGMIVLENGGIKGEYLILTYANDDKLYVPVSSLHLINRYIGSGSESTPLHKLGSNSWARAKKKAAEKARDVAAELLDIYAKRLSKPGHAFRVNKEKYQIFSKSFPFQTTSDQEIAINTVLRDMSQPVAMDRLVCGDVGFGKTEVAMRAAFLAVENKKQVAVLVPTTLLAQQHFDDFQHRFANWPVRIEMLSRFRNTKEEIEILHLTRTGGIDILIGTHKLLESKVAWKDLGLLIIDEEHRFGVRHKELIKIMRTNVDILTLTATPIPRTLNMALTGMRDLSIIATPPAHRLSVKTLVRQYDNLAVREAILREIFRGGQVYYLYNDVQNIRKTADRLSKLVPEARIGVGYGQMRELERVMNDFHHQRFNVLVCTTIIETGIDIPTANTIIIERADQFGLAQLHQLRGRVGRSHRQAYAWLLTPNPKEMNRDAQKRLEAIASLEDLGAGFSLATHDLEIRGAGELLGEEQSGSMEAIGLSLYIELLENAINALKAGREPSLQDLIIQQAEVDLGIPSLLPEDFIPDINTRLSFYKRIAGSKTNAELEEVKAELIDRFGQLPDYANNLINIAPLRQKAKKLGILKLEGNEKSITIEFSEKSTVNPICLIKLLKKYPKHFHFSSPTRIKFTKDLPGCKVRIDWVRNFLFELEENLIS